MRLLQDGPARIQDGKVRVEGIPPGCCKVAFPDRDKSAWTPIQAQSEEQSASAEAA